MKFIKKLLHDILDWGFPKQIKDNDSFLPTYSCQFCDSDLAQDSQGNWFHLSTYQEEL